MRFVTIRADDLVKTTPPTECLSSLADGSALPYLAVPAKLVKGT